MNRSSKKLRVLSGILMLGNFVAAGLPLAILSQKNYPDKIYSTYAYIKGIFDSSSLTYAGEGFMNADRVIWILAFLVLPLVLAAASFLWAIIGNCRQKISFVFQTFSLILYISMYVTMNMLKGALVHGETYTRGKGAVLFIGITAVSMIPGMIGVICSPEKEKMEEIADVIDIPDLLPEDLIPDLSTMEEQKDIPGKTDEDIPVKQSDDIPVEMRGSQGALIGVAGMYAGAVILFKNKETIRLGRAVDNDLIFSDQPKVSRHHCMITWNAERQRFVFNDISSNGSFVIGCDECIPQRLDIEILPGTEIALGDETNIIRLS